MRTSKLKLALNAIHYSGLSGFGGRWAGGIGTILMLHHVRNERARAFSPNAHLTVSPQFLEAQLSDLLQEGIEFVSMDEAIRRISTYRAHVSEKSFVTVTLDDGYRDNKEFAAPIFRKFNIPYTIYVAPGLVDGSSHLWWEDLENIFASRSSLYVDLQKGRTEIDISTDSKKTKEFGALVNYLTKHADEQQHMTIIRDLASVCGVDVEAHRSQSMMTWREIVELDEDSLCTIGAHTIHHTWLARQNIEEARVEMYESARIIQSELGYFPKHFAYPYGMPEAAGRREFELAKRLGFTSAVTTRHGVVYPDHQNHLTSLPRISLNGNFQEKKFTSVLMSGIPTLLSNRGKRLNVD